MSRKDSDTDTGERGEEGRRASWTPEWGETGGEARRRRGAPFWRRCLGACEAPGSPGARGLSGAFFSSQAAQVLLALIIAGIGVIFALNYFHFAQRFPLVFLTGYPFWGAFIVSTVRSFGGITIRTGLN